MNAHTTTYGDYKFNFHFVPSLGTALMMTEDKARKLAGDYAIDAAMRDCVHELRCSVKQKATRVARGAGMPWDSGYVQVTTRYV